MVKLDIYLTRNIDKDLARQALVTSAASFATKMGAVIVAEGAETADEARALQGGRRGLRRRLSSGVRDLSQ
ncbi:MAG: hypothetical protein ACRDHM_04895 [Actinomycetota bacterium]